MWLRGFVVVKKIELEGVNTAKIVLTTKGKPLGSSIYAPDEAGSISVRHESPKLLRLYEVDGNPLYSEFVKKLYGPFPSIEDAAPCLRFIGDVSLIGEGASASLTDSGRSVTHKLTVEVGFDINHALSETVPGKLLLLREFTCVAVEVQREIPLDDKAKIKQAPKQADIELELKVEPKAADAVADMLNEASAVVNVDNSDVHAVTQPADAPKPKRKGKFAMVDREEGEGDADWLDRSLCAHDNNASLGVIAAAMGVSAGVARKLIDENKPLFGVNPNGSVFSRKMVKDQVAEIAARQSA